MNPFNFPVYLVSGIDIRERQEVQLPGNRIDIALAVKRLIILNLDDLNIVLLIATSTCIQCLLLFLLLLRSVSYPNFFHDILHWTFLATSDKLQLPLHCGEFVFDKRLIRTRFLLRSIASSSQFRTVSGSRTDLHEPPSAFPAGVFCRVDAFTVPCILRSAVIIGTSPYILVVYGVAVLRSDFDATIREGGRDETGPALE